MSALHHIGQSSNCVPWSITLAPGGRYRLPELLVLRGTQKHPRLITVGELWPQPIHSAKNNTPKTYLLNWAKSLLCSDWFWPPNRTFHAEPSTATGGNPDGTRNGQHTHTQEKKHCTFREGCTQGGRTDGGESKIMHHDTKQEQIRESERTESDECFLTTGVLAGSFSLSLLHTFADVVVVCCNGQRRARLTCFCCCRASNDF